VLGAFIRFLVAIALGAVLLPATWMLLAWSARQVHGPPPDTIATAGGVALGILFAVWGRPNWLIHTFIHELCHLLTCWCLGVKVMSIRASDGKGGEVEHAQCDPVRGTLISIAPYTLPLFLAPLLAVRHLLVIEPGGWRHALSAAIGFAAILHLRGLWHNVVRNCRGPEADLVKAGRPLSLVLIGAALLALAAWTLRALWAGADSGF
jgi:hypothetical protein